LDQLAVEKQQEQESSTPSQKQQERRPFSWISTFPELLAERVEQEIVFHYVPLSENASGRNVAAVAATSEEAEEETEDTKMPPTPMDPVELLPLRRVDWETCSFRPSNSNGETELSNAENPNDPNFWKRTDIDPGKYEGGMKIWECSLDLVRFLAQQQHEQQQQQDDNADCRFAFTGGYVLELGCGHGLPACYLLRQALHQEKRQREQESDSTVTTTTTKPWTIVFTDYNDFVVQDVTVSNIMINAAAVDVPITHVLPHVVMGAGDWLDLSRQLQQHQQQQSPSETAGETANKVSMTEISSESSGAVVAKQLPADGKFDWILAAETIYSEQAAKETALFLVRHLKHTTGVALIATKRYYFGVGGGSDAFRGAVHAAVETEQQQLQLPVHVQVKVETVRVHDNGTGNIREILSVQLLPAAN
jgi:hypothetical protein